MSRPSPRSTLYRLIQAGQLAHHAVLAPLRDRGLEPGDDAVLFELGRHGLTREQLANALGIPAEAITPRIDRLVERELVVHRAVGAELLPGVALTERGIRIRNALAEHWEQLEEALMGELKPKQRKTMAERLGRFVELLSL
jgi:DNA-binding MarR family transcriptional regulator